MSFKQQVIASMALTMLGLIFLVFTLGFGGLLNTPAFYLGIYLIVLLPLFNGLLISIVGAAGDKRGAKGTFRVPVFIIGLLSFVIFPLSQAFTLGIFIYWLGINMVVAFSNWISFRVFQSDEQ